MCSSDLLFYNNNLHQDTRSENETLAVGKIAEVRDDFALRGRCEMYRVDLKSMATANQLHQGTNLRSHRVYAPYAHFQRLLTIRNQEPDEELLDVLVSFSEDVDARLFMRMHSITGSASCKLA